MLKVAIVEDVKVESDLLKSMLITYGEDNSVIFDISVFLTVKSFFDVNCNFDLIFLDIELEDGNGMELAKKIRETNDKVMIIFVTNMAQYALKGYEVRAFDFIVKPILYENFKVKLHGALKCFDLKKEINIWVSNKDGKTQINSSNIKYIEVYQHMLIYHLSDGNNLTVAGALSSVEKMLKDNSFVLCNRCYLVNLKYVTSVSGYDCYLGKDKILISRMKRSSFMRRLNDFLAESD